MKKLIFAVSALIATSLSAQETGSGTSIFSEIFSDIMFPNVNAAFDAYAGNWAGAQRIIVGETEIARGTIEQRAIMTNVSGSKRLVVTGKIINSNGESFPTRSVMYVRGDRLYIDVRSLDGRVNTYVGKIDLNTVKWFTREFFMNYDYQVDTFYKTPKGMLMSSVSMRYIEVPSESFKGLLIVENKLEKSNPVFDRKQYNSTKMGVFGNPED